MAKIVLPYQIVLGRPRPMPLCTLLVEGRTGTAAVRAVVDSGAEQIVLPVDVAREAGVDLTEAKQTVLMYGSGPAPAWKVRAPLRIGSLLLRPPICFVETLALPYALLGREGSFSHFREVAFVEHSDAPRVELRG